MQLRTRRNGSRLAATIAAFTLITGLAGCASEDPAERADTGPAADGTFPRTVQHHKGKTTLQRRPERIVALDNSLVEAVIALDRPLAGGIGSYRDLKGFPPYLGDAVKDTKDVGPLDSPDLEAIAALEPDLIVSASVRHEALYDELSAIAPTVFVETTGPTWKDNITKLGETLGAEDKAKQELAAYEARAKQIGAAVNEKLGNPSMSMVRFLDGPTRLMANTSFTGIIFADLGFARPKAQDVDEFAVEIGEEQIRKADGDHIFVSVFSGGEQANERFLRNPLWRNLNGVKAGNVHEVDDATWMTSVSLQGAEIVMDDLAKMFDVDPMKA